MSRHAWYAHIDEPQTAAPTPAPALKPAGKAWRVPRRNGWHIPSALLGASLSLTGVCVALDIASPDNNNPWGALTVAGAVVVSVLWATKETR